MATSTLPRPARRERRSRREAAPTRPAWNLDRVILAAAAVGLLVSAYLLLVDLTGSTTLCTAGADCDNVRASAYGRVFGLPMALLGVGFFLAAGLAVGAAALMRAWWQPYALQLLGGAGAGAAILFVSVQGLVLNAWCPYCLVADGAALAIGLRVGWLSWLARSGAGRSASRSSVQHDSLGASLARGLVGAVLSVGVLLLGYAASPASSTAGASAPATSADDSEQLAALAGHLRESGAVFYGAYWCPHCQNQKTLFGAAASRLPYVECDPRGSNGQPAACQAAGVQAYPTWVIGGQKLKGELSVSELARLSGFSQ